MLLLFSGETEEVFIVAESQISEAAVMPLSSSIPEITEISVLSPIQQGIFLRFQSGIERKILSVFNSEIRSRETVLRLFESTLLSFDKQEAFRNFPSAMSTAIVLSFESKIRGREEILQVFKSNISIGEQSLTAVLHQGILAGITKNLPSNIFGEERQEVSITLASTIAGIAISASVLSVFDSPYASDPAFFPGTTWDVFLGDISIKGMVADMTISYDRGAPHNNISISSSDRFFFEITATLTEESIVKVIIDAREIFFLLEDRTIGDDHSFSLVGRSLSILYDVGYSESIDFDIMSPGWGLTSEMLEDRGETIKTLGLGRASARRVVEFLLEEKVEWDESLPEWVLYKFSHSGTIMDVVSEIGRIANAAVRCLDDGTIYVGPIRKVRPIYVYDSSPEHVFNRSRLLTNSENAIDYGTGANAIIVNGYEPEIELPDLEVEEKSPIIGDDVHVRAYWKSGRTVYYDPESGGLMTLPVSTYVTDGTVKEVGSGIAIIGADEDTPGEAVTFSEGRASVGKPIYNLVSHEWTGTPGGDISYEQFGKDLVITGQWGLAKVIYESAYIRYLISGSNVESLLMALILQENQGIFVDLKMQRDGVVGTVYAEEISDQRLTSAIIAQHVGTVSLDEERYDRFSRRVEVPYSACIDGDIVAIENPKLSFAGNHYVEGATIEFNSVDISQQLDLSQFVL